MSVNHTPLSHTWQRHALLFCLFLLTVGWMPIPRVMAADSDQVVDGLQFIDSAQDGMLFLDGQFVPGPYSISATETLLLINDQKIVVEATEPRSSRPGNSNAGRRQLGNRGPGGGPGGPGGGPGFRNGRRRPRPFQEEQSRGQDENALEDEYYEDEYDSVRGLARTGRTVSGWLQNDYIVFLNSPGKASYFSDASQIYPLFEILLSPVPTSAQLAGFDDSRPNAFSTESWTQFRQNIDRTDALDSQMYARMSAIEKLEEENEYRVRAVRRMENLSYPLTVIGMLLSVIAFGHMLQWSGRGLAAISDKAVTPESERYGVVALWLMMGMSLVDLCWTVLASQAGAMHETNPLAAGMLDSPLRLAVFKVLATGVGLGILYAWRRRAQIQQATWWMCLVCVLLTFRWVVFDSLS